MTRQKQTKITLTEQLKNMLQEMKKEHGFATINDVIYHCIRYTMANYGKDKTSKVNGAKSDPKTKKQNNQMAICAMLEGTISPDGETCTYYKYDEKLRFEQVIPITMLEQVMVDNQYTPNKERVLKLQELGKTKY